MAQDGGTAGTDLVQIGGKDGTTARVAAVDASGRLIVTTASAAPSNNAADKAEDAAHASGDTGTFVLGVRNDAAAARTSTDGDYSPLATDSAGRVGIADLGGAISVDDNGSSLTVDNAALTAASAANLSAATVSGAALVTEAGNWAVNHSPAANTQATASKAAGGAGVRHVATAVTFDLITLGAAPTAATVNVNLRDGASGAGTVLMTWVLRVPPTADANPAHVTLGGLNLVGSANTAMTLEFSAAGGANTQEAVSLTGYSIS